MIEAAAERGRDRLLSIGAFAHRSRLSIKALRLYESSGLLVPADVNPATGTGGTGRASCYGRG